MSYYVRLLYISAPGALRFPRRLRARKIQLLPRDAMHNRGLCHHAVCVRPCVRLSVCPSCLCILSKRVAHTFYTVG